VAELEIDTLKAFEVADFEFGDHSHGLAVFCICPARSKSRPESAEASVAFSCVRRKGSAVTVLMPVLSSQRQRRGGWEVWPSDGLVRDSQRG
jgi:hypothetical protein